MGNLLGFINKSFYKKYPKWFTITITIIIIIIIWTILFTLFEFIFATLVGIILFVIVIIILAILGVTKYASSNIPVSFDAFIHDKNNENIIVEYIDITNKKHKITINDLEYEGKTEQHLNGIKKLKIYKIQNIIDIIKKYQTKNNYINNLIKKLNKIIDMKKKFENIYTKFHKTIVYTYSINDNEIPIVLHNFNENYGEQLKTYNKKLLSNKIILLNLEDLTKNYNAFRKLIEISQFKDYYSRVKFNDIKQMIETAKKLIIYLNKKNKKK